MRYTQKRLCSQILSLIFCVFLFVFWGCQKEITFDNLPGNTNSNAVFTLVPSDSNCSTDSIFGSYNAGTRLNASNKVSILVNVTQPGTWSLSTGAINGYSFSGSGKFTTTGQQNIILKGSGAPLMSGVDSFPINVANVACGFGITVNGSSNAGGTNAPDSTFYYKATIGGKNYLEAVTKINGFAATSDVSGNDDVYFISNIGPLSSFNNPSATNIEIQKGIMHHYLSATNSDFKAFFKQGTYTYAPTGIQPFINGNGIYIIWTDSSGVNWSTGYGSGNQSGSTFKIVSVTDASDALGTYYVKVKMQFNCNLYKDQTGELIKLTKGEYVGLFGKY